MIHRRALLRGLFAAPAAPAIVVFHNLMPIKALPVMNKFIAFPSIRKWRIIEYNIVRVSLDDTNGIIENKMREMVGDWMIHHSEF